MVSDGHYTVLLVKSTKFKGSHSFCKEFSLRTFISKEQNCLFFVLCTFSLNQPKTERSVPSEYNCFITSQSDRGTPLLLGGERRSFLTWIWMVFLGMSLFTPFRVRCVLGCYRYVVLERFRFSKHSNLKCFGFSSFFKNQQSCLFPSILLYQNSLQKSRYFNSIKKILVPSKVFRVFRFDGKIWLKRIFHCTVAKCTSFGVSMD